LIELKKFQNVKVTWSICFGSAHC